MSSNGTAAFYRRTRLLGIAGLVFAASLIFLRSGQSSRSPTLNEPPLSLAHSATAPQTLRSASTKPIEEIRVGDRVLARNPEVSDAERQHWRDPDWNDWLHLSLIMSKPDGSKVNIELLRPESWVLERVSFATDNWNLSGACPDFGATSQIGEKQSWHLLELDLPQAKEDCSVPFSPLRPVFRGIALTLAQRQTTDDDFPGVTVQVDLPEMGASGTAFVRAVNPCPPIRSGEGQPVTATFAHRSTTPILDVVFEGESKPIGVTDNHLFWSIDRQRFIPIGQMAIGERVQTHSGETKRIEGRLPRPGPQVVYNLEVYGEHVYFVGQQGVLAHNLYEVNGNVVYRDAYDELLPTASSGLVRGSNPSRLIYKGFEVRAVRNFDHIDDSTLRGMAKYGFSPKDVNGNKIVLHHLDQNPTGPIVEMPGVRHSIHNSIQHPLGNAPGAGLTAEQRTAFNAWRENYWKTRAAEELTKRGIKP
ncbi:HNH/ENDO VII family nuclease [Roseiconus lacunae]|uniref:HNH/ENDO VII family nuclease n=1 Tax=Roseiconus lacunae TaxID=2605694 RepID=UPI0030889F07|nr:HNH/ENDO VII family nuclease [Stieleria sp. HD01]